MPRVEKKVWAYGTFIALLGILVILMTILFEEAYKPLSHGKEIAVSLLDHLGIAFISIGIIGIIVDLNDWRKYFQQRIADTTLARYTRVIISTVDHGSWGVRYHGPA